MARSRKIRKTGDCRARYLVGTRAVTAKSLRFNVRARSDHLAPFGMQFALW